MTIVEARRLIEIDSDEAVAPLRLTVTARAASEAVASLERVSLQPADGSETAFPDRRLTCSAQSVDNPGEAGHRPDCDTATSPSPGWLECPATTAPDRAGPDTARNQ
ncbi:MAG: hypothetical protein ACLFQ5_11950 [Oceanicaulis sp.]